MQTFLIGDVKLKHVLENNLLNSGRILMSLPTLFSDFPSNSIIIDCSMKNTIESFTEAVECCKNNIGGRIYYVFSNRDLIQKISESLSIIDTKVTAILVPEVLDSLDDSRLFSLLKDYMNNPQSFTVDTDEFVHLSISTQISESITDILSFSYNDENNIIIVDSQQESRLIDCLSFLVKKLGLNHNRLDELYAQSPMKDIQFFIKKTNLFNTSSSSKDALCYCIYLYKENLNKND